MPQSAHAVPSDEAITAEVKRLINTRHFTKAAELGQAAIADRPLEIVPASLAFQVALANNLAGRTNGVRLDQIDRCTGFDRITAADVARDIGLHFVRLGNAREARSASTAAAISALTSGDQQRILMADFLDARIYLLEGLNDSAAEKLNRVIRELRAIESRDEQWLTNALFWQLVNAAIREVLPGRFTLTKEFLKREPSLEKKAAAILLTLFGSMMAGAYATLDRARYRRALREH